MIDIDAAFTYHRPNDNQIDRIDVVRNAAFYLARAIKDCCPESAEQTLAIRKVEEASMWANKAIVLPRGEGFVQRGAMRRDNDG